MNTEYIITQDIGQYSCKAALFTLDGDLVRSNVVYYMPNLSAKGLSSISPHVWWEAFCTNCKKLLAGILPEAVKGVCVCGQMMSCIPMGENGECLHEYIAWDDKRSMSQIKRIRDVIGARKIYSITGVCLSHMFSLPKIMWMKENYPDIYQKVKCFIQCKDYISYRLSGVIATDTSDAGFTMMFDLYQQKWSETILQSFGISPDKMAKVVPFGTVLGNVTSRAAAESGLSTKTLVIEGLGDGRAPMVGSGLQQKGDAMIYLGSVSWISQVTDSLKMDKKMSLTKSAYTTPNLFLNGGTVLSGGLSVQWFLKTFYPCSNHDGMLQELFEAMERTPIGSRGLIFMPYLCGERSPWWNDYAKAGFIGLDVHHTRADFFRSVIEGVSLQLAIVKNIMTDLESFNKVYLTGRVVTAQWQQLLSDILDIDIISTNIKSFSGCQGAAVVAGVGLGIYKDYSEAIRFHRDHYHTSPIKQNVEQYAELLPVFEDCYAALQDINIYLSRIRR